MLLMVLLGSSLWASTITLDKDTDQVELGLFLEILEDPEGKWQIEDVSSSTFSQKFTLSEKISPNFGYSSSVYWVKISIQNLENKPNQWFLEVRYPFLDSIQFYRNIGDGEWASKETGDHFSFDSRSVNNRYFVFDVDFDRSVSTDIYFRIETTSSIQFPITLYREATYHQKTINDQTVLGLYYGMMLVMVFYNLFIFFSVKDRVYLHYVVYVTAYIIFQMTLNGLGFQ